VKWLKELLLRKTTALVAQDAWNLAKALECAPTDGAEIELRSDLKTKIAEVSHTRN
jgi:hypothetical protein